MRQQNGQRKFFPVFRGLVCRVFGALLAAAALSACSALNGGDDPDLTGDNVNDVNWAYSSKTTELETEVARLKAENARLQTRVMELERIAKVDKPRDAALREGKPVGLARAGSADAGSGATLVVPAPTPAPALKSAVVAKAGDGPLSTGAVPVEQAPRLVQPTFASTETVFENEADENDIEMTSVLYGVHLASYRRVADARAGWSKLQRENPDELGLLEPRVKEITIPEKGKFIRLIGGGFASEDKAKALCKRLKQKGVYCSVMGFDGEPLQPAESG